MPDWDMNGDTTRTGYEAQIRNLKAELDQAVGVIADRNKEIADLRGQIEDDLEPGQLRACPFCGGEARRYDDEEGGTAIECMRCQASTALHFEFKKNLERSWNDRVARPAADREVIREALKPFAAIAEADISDDETDDDLYRPMSAGNNYAPLLRVGDLRRAVAALALIGEG